LISIFKIGRLNILFYFKTSERPYKGENALADRPKNTRAACDRTFFGLVAYCDEFVEESAK